MQMVYPRCCGLDVHKKTVVACVLLTEPTGRVRREVRTFGAMTADLLAHLRSNRPSSGTSRPARRCAWLVRAGTPPTPGPASAALSTMPQHERKAAICASW